MSKVAEPKSIKIQDNDADYYTLLEAIDKSGPTPEMGENVGRTGLKRAISVWSDPSCQPVIAGVTGIMSSTIPFFTGIALLPGVQTIACSIAAAMCTISIGNSVISISKDTAFITKYIATSIADKLPSWKDTIKNESLISPRGMIIACQATMRSMKEAIAKKSADFVAPIVEGYRESKQQISTFDGLGLATYATIDSKLLGSNNDKGSKILLKMIAGTTLSGGLTAKGISASSIMLAFADPLAAPAVTAAAAFGVTALVFGAAASTAAKLRTKLEAKKELDGALVSFALDAASLLGQVAAPASMLASTVKSALTNAEVAQKLLEISPAMSHAIEQAAKHCVSALAAGVSKSDAIDSFLKSNSTLFEDATTKATKSFAQSMGHAIDAVRDVNPGEHKILEFVTEAITKSAKEKITEEAVTTIKKHIEQTILPTMDETKAEAASIFLRRRLGVAIGKVADFFPAMKNAALIEARALISPAVNQNLRSAQPYGAMALAGYTKQKRPSSHP